MTEWVFLPAALQDITGINRERLLDLRRRTHLGLTQSDDEPILATFSRKVVEFDELLNRLHNQARRELGPDKAPAEAKWL
jgi:hypothetical protein